MIEVQGLSKYYGPIAAIEDVTFHVSRGEVIGFLGPNGAGKTTTLSMLCGLLRPDAGRAWVHGRPVDGGSPEVRARVGVCPQEVVVWKDLTCLEQLALAGAMYDVDRRTARARSLDSSRWLNNASGWVDKGVGDVTDTHEYPGPNCKDPEPTRATRPPTG